MMNNSEQPPVANSTEPSVGNILREAREQRGLALKDVAQQLNLKADILQSIESDEPDSSILPTFMRGYVRAYARFLKVPELPLLAKFEHTHQVKSAPVKTMKTFSNRQAKQQTEARFMWLTYVIAAILLASLTVWLWQGARDFGVLGENTDPAIVQLQEESAPLLDTTTPPSSWPVTEPVVNTDSLLPAEAVEVPAATAELPSVAALPAEVQQQLATLNQAESTPTAATESFGDSSDSGLDRLKMTFADNCWIDVVDANGERVAYGTKQAGYIMELSAKAPFVITLGNPSVVTIELNQQPYDMSQYPGGRVAKFTLSGQD